jgi:beta-1,4-galactosyltransferase 1
MWKIAESLSPGGEFIPDCHKPHDVAIIVPYRNRAVFVGHIHPFLMNQRIIHYQIYIINQSDEHEFNRASLMNVGFNEALKGFDWTCFIFHDVDHLPEDTRNLYSRPDQPRVMGVELYNALLQLFWRSCGA